MKNKIGTYLRQHREEKKLTLEQVAEHTGIREPYLEDLENGDFHKIPGDVFIRGFLRNYGNYLGLDGNGLVEAYRTGSEPEKILKDVGHTVPQPEAPKNTDTIILRKALDDMPVHGSKPEQKPAEPVKPVAQPAKPEAESFDKVAALKEMEPVGYGYKSHKDKPQPEAPVESPEKRAMEETRIMKPLKPSAQPNPEAKPENKPAEPVKPAAAAAAAAAVTAGAAKAEAARAETKKPEPAAKPAQKPAEPAKKAPEAAPKAAAVPEKGKKHGSPKQALKKMEKALNKENVEEALTDSKAKMGGFLDRVHQFIDDNLYETVPEDEEGEEYGATSADSGSKAPAFSFKVFTAVFVVCLGIFTVVMAYFVFGGKTTPDLKATDSITDGVKSDHSSEKTPENKKEAEETKAKQEEAKGDDKTLGKGNGVTVVVTYKKPVWTQTTIDGKTVEAATIPKGSTRTYKGSKSVSVNVGSIRDVTITVNGKEVPYGSKEWGVVTRTFKAK